MENFKYFLLPILLSLELNRTQLSTEVGQIKEPCGIGGLTIMLLEKTKTRERKSWIVDIGPAA